MITQDTIKLAEAAYEKLNAAETILRDLKDKEQASVESPQSIKRQDRLRVLADQTQQLATQLTEMYS